MNYPLIYSMVNFVIFVPVVYFSYRIVQNIREDTDAASAMFFLKNSSKKTFKYGALLVSFVLSGQTLVFSRFFFDDRVLILGYSILIVASIGVLYFVRGIFEVTLRPTEAEDRDF